MPLHDWTRVSAGTFHHVHTAWITHLAEALNRNGLPDGYYALAEQHAGQTIPDVLTLTSPDDDPLGAPPEGGVALAEAPPEVQLHMTADEATVYRTARRTLVIRHRSSRRIVAMIEIVSPGNKDGEHHLRQFVDKSVSALQQGIHLLVIDPHPGPFDPQGIHGEIWPIVGSAFTRPSNGDRALISYRADALPDAFFEAMAVGDTFRPMPLFLSADWYVPTPLEPTYQAAYEGSPPYVRDIVEGRADPEDFG